MANYDSDDSEATLVWSAHDEVDETLKDIFENKLATATKNVLDVEVTPEKTYKKFILNSRGFFNLQAYVVSAADLPQNDQRFQDIMPKDKCKKLTELDAEIYEKTKTAIVGVASSCATFANDGMPKMVTSALLTISYCKYALRNLVQDEETNIRHNLEIIMQDKYKEKDSWDDDFYDARDTAKTSLEELAEQASKKKEEVDKIYNILSTFKTQTMSYDSQIKFLRQQYKDGPVKNPNKDITQPYATILNAKLQKAIDDTVKFLKEAEDEKDRKNTGLAVGIALFWFGPIGCIAITSAILSISELNVKIKALETELAQARSDQAEITLLLEKVNMVTKQFEDIGEKMEHAIQGLTELSKLFSTQFETYDTLATYLGDLENAVVKQVALRMRKKYIMKHLNGSIQAFQDLLASAEEFKETVMSQADLESWKAKANKDLTK